MLTNFQVHNRVDHHEASDQTIQDGHPRRIIFEGGSPGADASEVCFAALPSRSMGRRSWYLAEHGYQDSQQILEARNRSSWKPSQECLLYAYGTSKDSRQLLRQCLHDVQAICCISDRAVIMAWTW